MHAKKILSSKITIFFLASLLLFFGALKFRQLEKQKAIREEKNKLIEQENSLKKRNEDLLGTLANLNSDSYKERVAREELNLKREGEFVYNFSNIEESSNEKPKTSFQPGESNPVKWWNYFFNNN